MPHIKHPRLQFDQVNNEPWRAGKKSSMSRSHFDHQDSLTNGPAIVGYGISLYTLGKGVLGACGDLQQEEADQ